MTVVLVAAALVAACGSGSKDGGVLTGDADAVAWMDRVCTAVTPISTLVRNPPKQASPTTQATYVASVLAALDRALTDATRVGRSPIDGGDAEVAELEASLRRGRDHVAGVKARVDTSPTPLVDYAWEASVSARGALLAGMQRLSGGRSEYGRLYQDAASCRQPSF